MKTRLLVIPFTALLFTACIHGKPKKTVADITRDTLSYTYQTVKQRAADCNNKPDSGCTVVKIKYPAFASNNQLNDTVTAHLLTLALPGYNTVKDLQTQATNFIAAYEQYKKQKKSRKIAFALTTYAKVLRQDSSLVTIEVAGYSFAGGAHGETLTHFINWNTKANQNIALDDILIAGYKQPLNAIAEKIFRKNENLKDTSTLIGNYFFKDGKFALNNNYLITPVGIRFVYNQYEIKPYAAGTTDLFIPYSLIKQLLKPNTVLAQYIK